MKKYKLYCAKYNSSTGEFTNKSEIPEREFLVNGYSFAGRLLEDVMFRIKFSEDGKVVDTKVHENHADYFEQFNEKKFLKLASKFAQSELEQGEEIEVDKKLMKKYCNNDKEFIFFVEAE